MIVQIYEIQTPDEAEKCIELGVDHIGSVLLSRDQWKQPPIREVIGLTRSAGARPSLIPLFDDRETLYRVVDYYGPDYLHFCDGLTDDIGRASDLDRVVERLTDLKERYGSLRIMRTIPVPVQGLESDFPSLDLARALEGVSDIFLIDTWIGKAPVEGFVGITGLPADWGLSRRLVVQSPVPVILAGGLGPDNVYDAVLEIMPAGADSCTRTNATDAGGNPVRFKKDFQKVDQFVREIRKAEQALRTQKQELLNELDRKKDQLQDRERALPAHSVRPHQLQVIEELEEEITAIEKELNRFKSI